MPPKLGGQITQSRPSFIVCLHVYLFPQSHALSALKELRIISTMSISKDVFLTFLHCEYASCY